MSGRSDKFLDVNRLRRLFRLLDDELWQMGRREPFKVLVAGGAALAFKWSQRGTYDVDLVHGRFPADVRRAVVTIAERETLEWNWMNNGGLVGEPLLEPQPMPLYRGKAFEAYSPGDRYLLAMKLLAGRVKDMDDAVRLSEETGLVTVEQMKQLLSDAYEVVYAPMEHSAEEVAREVARRRLSNEIVSTDNSLLKSGDDDLEL